jgi:hypothetical protein
VEGLRALGGVALLALAVGCAKPEHLAPKLVVLPPVASAVPPPDPCRGADVDLKAAMRAPSCIEPEPDGYPSEVKRDFRSELQVVTPPAPGAPIALRFTIHNDDSIERTVFVLVSTMESMSFDMAMVDASDAAGRDVTSPRVAGAFGVLRIMDRPEARRVARVIVAPGGTAHADFAWSATGYPGDKTYPTDAFRHHESWPPKENLPPGRYELRARLGIAGAPSAKTQVTLR